MAKDSFDFDDDLGMDFDDMDFAFDDMEVSTPKKSKARKITEAAAVSFAGGVTAKVTDSQWQRNIIRNGLPDGFDVAYDTAGKIKDGISDIASDVSREYGRAKKEMQRSVRQILPKVKQKLPKKMADKLERFGGVDTRRNYGPQKSDEDTAIDSATADIFGGQSRDEYAAEKAETEISTLVERKISLSSNKSLDILARFAQKRDAYHDGPGQKLEKTKIAIMYRQLFAQLQSKDHIKELLELSKVRFEEIVKYTGLPDLVKENHSDVAQGLMRKNFYGKVTEQFTNSTNGIIDRVRGRLNDSIKGATDAFMMNLSMLTDGAEAYLDQQQMEKEMEDLMGFENERELTPEEKEKKERLNKQIAMIKLAGNQAGGAAGNWFGKKATKFLKGKYGESDEAKRIGLAAKNISQDPQKYYQQMIKDVHKMPMLGPLLRLMGVEQDLDKGPGSLVQRDQTEDLNKRARFDLKTKKMLEVVYPGYMSMILRELTMARTGGSNVQRIVYSWDRDAFENEGSARDRIVKKIFGSDGGKSAADQISQIYKKFDSKNELPEDAKKEVLDYIFKQAQTSTGNFNMRDLVSEDSPLSAGVKTTVAEFIKDKHRITADDGKIDAGPDIGGLTDFNQEEADAGRLVLNGLSRKGISGVLRHRIRSLGQNTTLDYLRADAKADTETQQTEAELRALMNSVRSSLGGGVEEAIKQARLDNNQALIEGGVLKEDPNRTGNWNFNNDLYRNQVLSQVDTTPTPPPESNPPPTPPVPPTPTPPSDPAGPTPGPGVPPTYHSGGLVGEPNNAQIMEITGGKGEASLDVIRQRLGSLRGKTGKGFEKLKLKSDEMLALLKIGEEVLTPDDPRHIKNLKDKGLDKLKALGINMGAAVEDVKEKGTEKLKAVGAKVKASGIEEAKEKLVEKVKAVDTETLKEKADGLVQAAKVKSAITITNLVSDAPKAFEEAKQKVKDTKDKVLSEENMERMRAVKDDTIGRAKDAGKKISESTSEMYDKISEKFSTSMEKSNDYAKQQVDKLEELIGVSAMAAMTAVANAPEMAEEAKQKLMGMFTGVKEGAKKKGITRRVGGMFGKLAIGATKLQAKMIGKGVKFGAKVTGGVAGGIGKAVGAFTTSKGGLSNAKEAADVFVKGNKDPILYQSKMHSGEYFDQSNQSPITCPADIKGPVVDKTGAVIVTHDDLKKGLYVIGKSGLMKVLGLAGRGIKGSFSLAMIPAKIGLKMLRGMKNLGKSIIGAFTYVEDIFVMGEETPRLRSAMFNNGGYFTPDGKVITKLSQIVRGVYDADSNLVLSPADIGKGLFYKNGKEVKLDGMSLSKVIRGAGKMIMGGAKLTGKIMLAPIKLLGKIVKGTMSLPFRNNEDAGGKTVQYLDQIYKLLDERMNNPNKVKEGSAEQKRLEEIAGDAMDGKEPEVDKDGKPVEKKSGIGGMILAAMGGLVGKFVDFKNKSLGYLKTMAMAKLAGQGLETLSDMRNGGEGGNDENGRGRRGRRGRGRGRGGANDGDDGGDDDNGRRGGRSAAMKWGGRAAIGAAAYGAGSYMMGDNGEEDENSMLGAAAGIAGTTALTIGAEKLIMSPVARGVAMQGARMAGTALLGLLSAPVVIGLAVGAAVAYGAYKLYKYVKNKQNALTNFKLSQYGISVDDADQASKIITLEKMLLPAVTIVAGKATLSRNVKATDVTNLFGIDPKNTERLSSFLIWFNQRFKPVYLGWITAIVANGGKPSDMEDVDKKLTGTALEKVFGTIHITDDANPHPYAVMSTPFGGALLTIGRDKVDAEFKQITPTINARAKKTESNGKLSTPPVPPSTKSAEEKAKESSIPKTEDPQSFIQRAKNIADKAISSIPVVGGMYNAAKTVVNAVSTAVGNYTGSNVTGAEISAKAPKNAEDHEKLLLQAAKKYGITDPTEVKMFLAQCAHESGWFKYTKELGGPKYYAKYEGRKDLGNTQAGDGVKFPGRGYIQLTGRGNYTAFAKASGLDVINDPDMISRDPLLSAEVSAFWWTHCQPKVRKAAQAGDVKRSTKLVNGGYNGLADRIEAFKHYNAKFGGKDPMADIGGGGVGGTGGSGGAPAAGTGAAPAPNSNTPTSMPGMTDAKSVLQQSTSGQGTPLNRSPAVTTAGVGVMASSGAVPYGQNADIKVSNQSAPWMDAATAELGVNEGNNPNRIAEYHAATPIKGGASTPWCASFVNWCLKKVGLKGSGSAAAASFMKFGTPIPLTQAIPFGAIVVVKVSNTGSGNHVFFSTGESNGRVTGIGGNQGGKKQNGGGVTKTSFPKDKVKSAVMPSGSPTPMAAARPAAGTAAAPAANNSARPATSSPAAAVPGSRTTLQQAASGQAAPVSQRNAGTPAAAIPAAANRSGAATGTGPRVGGTASTAAPASTPSNATGDVTPAERAAGGAAAVNTGQMNRPQKMADFAARNAKSTSSGYCARYVSNAMEHAGYKIGRGNADTYIEKCLIPAGFKKIAWGTPPSTGDIVHWSGVPKHKWGHIQIWTGKNWVSDFVQRSIQCWKDPAGSVATHWRDGQHMNGSAPIPIGTNGAADARTAATPTTSNQPVTGSQPTRTPGSVPTDVSGANPGLNQTASNANLEQQRAQQAIGAAATAQLQQQQLGEMVKMNTSLSAIHSLMKEMASKYNPSASTDKADNPSPKDSQGMDKVLDKNSAPKEGPGGFNKPDRAFGRPVVDFSQ